MPCCEFFRRAGENIPIPALDDLVGVALLGQEQLAVHREFLFLGILRDDAVEVRGTAVALGTQHAAEALGFIQKDFSAYCCDEAQTLEMIRECFRGNGYLPDTHTAVALHAAKEYRENEGQDAPLVVLSTASPFKFPAAVLGALGESAEGDAFAQMEKLEQVTGLQAPESLRGLRNRAVLHRDVIEKNDIADYVAEKLKLFT